MKWQDYRLDSDVSKAAEDVTLWRNEKGILEIAGDTLAVKILLDDQPSGYVFHGKGKLLLDTIVETEKGAVGKPVERLVDEPFLMLGRSEMLQQHLCSTEREDFTRLAYEEQEQYLLKAQDLLDMFFEGSISTHTRSKTFGEDGGFVFALPNEKGKLDILVARAAELVYTSTDKVFVSKGEKVVLKSSGEVVVSRLGKSVLIAKNCCPSIYIYKGDSE